MRLYLDENSASKELVARLTTVGHEVIDVLRGVDDLVVWEHSQEQGAAVVTENAVDFVPLAEHAADHWGLLLIYRENDRERDMTAAAVVVRARPL